MAYQARGRDPLFDSNMQAAIEKRGKELLGLGLIALGLMVSAMIYSYSPDDPSWLSSTDAPVRNWMGSLGASIAAPLFMIVGLGSWGLALVLLAWGLRFTFHRGDERAAGSIAFAPIWIALAAIYGAGLPVSEGWPHSFGLGGLFGDMMMGSLLNLLPLGTAVSLNLVSLFMGAVIVVFGVFVLGFTRLEIMQIAKFLIVGVIMVYATLMTVMGRGASGAVRAAQTVQARQAERRAQARMAEEDAAAFEAEMMGKAPAPRSEPLVNRAPQPEFEEDLALDDADPFEAKAEPKAGFLSRMPKLVKRAPAPEVMPEPELVAYAPAAPSVKAPESDRISARIAEAVKSRKKAAPVAAPMVHAEAGEDGAPIFLEALHPSHGGHRSEPPLTSARSLPTCSPAPAVVCGGPALRRRAQKAAG